MSTGRRIKINLYLSLGIKANSKEQNVKLETQKSARKKYRQDPTR